MVLFVFVIQNKCFVSIIHLRLPLRIYVGIMEYTWNHVYTICLHKFLLSCLFPIQFSCIDIVAMVGTDQAGMCMCVFW